MDTPIVFLLMMCSIVTLSSASEYDYTIAVEAGRMSCYFQTVEDVKYHAMEVDYQVGPFLYLKKSTKFFKKTTILYSKFDIMRTCSGDRRRRPEHQLPSIVRWQCTRTRSNESGQ
jgi:hypothetical protein